MKNFISIGLIAPALMLSACSDNKSETTKTGEAVEQAAENTRDTASDLVDRAKAEAEKIIGGVELDMSSLDSFKASLATMKENLNSTQQSQLTQALSSLAKDAVKSEGGALSSARSLASGKSTNDILYENMKSQLDGKTFEEILALAS